jgi:hypothetical protein
MPKHYFTLAVFALFLPAAASAKDLPGISAKLGLLHANAKARSVRFRVTEIPMPATIAEVQALTPRPFYLRFRGNIGKVRQSSAGIDWAGGELRVSAVSVKSLHPATNTIFYNYNRFAEMTGSASLSQDIGTRDSVSLGATLALDRRRPAFVVAAHNHYRTLDRAATISWQHGDSFRLSGGLFSSTPSGSRTFAERFVELAGGAPRNIRGYGLVAQFSPADASDALTVGFDFRNERDADAGHRGSRVALFVKDAF